MLPRGRQDYFLIGRLHKSTDAASTVWSACLIGSGWRLGVGMQPPLQHRSFILDPVYEFLDLSIPPTPYPLSYCEVAAVIHCPQTTHLTSTPYQTLTTKEK